MMMMSLLTSGEVCEQASNVIVNSKMLSTRLSPRSHEENSLIIKDVTPHSISADDEQCLCTCSCCPNLSDWCIKDAFGLTCAIFTWFLFFYGEVAVVFVIFTPSNYPFLVNLINLIVFHALQFLAISSHCRAMFSNPGAVPLNNATPENLHEYENGTVVYRCTACKSIKPARTHHCRVCKRCIRRMDHHCVFINNCVGENNQKYFILFTVYTCLISIYGLGVVGVHIPRCIQSNWIACPAWSPPITLILLIFLTLEAFSFALFTAIMTGTQVYAIYTDITGIEALKDRERSHRVRRSFLSSMQSIFGTPVSWQWLNPYSKPFYFRTENEEHLTFDV